ncbi:hypothetical protein SAMN02927937_01409 [Paenimyroides aquimaris]|uniref:YDG domain-containing protein n=1 Tax=Paenimyroides marinum TaxID=1159016 RepID=A0A1H6KR17_9FLAO|nr:hypothetical protein [Paenimyroides aquimaris]SEH78240.1 hypothetical protein SAMN02927937_01409 [Paenimyroides aquimaris]
MLLIISKFWVPKGFSGITIFPFVFVRDKFWTENNRFVNHEKIHIRQQSELLILLFFIWYFAEFLIRWIQFKNKKQAYRNISFEREAYTNEQNLDYLKNRRFFSFINYL